jgi:hypothetical protein
VAFLEHDYPGPDRHRHFVETETAAQTLGKQGLLSHCWADHCLRDRLLDPSFLPGDRGLTDQLAGFGDRVLPNKPRAQKS